MSNLEREREFNDPTSYEQEQLAVAKPLLTIAIPTYNRAVYLRELLSVLIDQLVNESRVELIVSDNASPDDTPTLVREYQDRGLGIRYIRNDSNLGADRNILQCFEQAGGKYVWIFGDDDLVVTNAVGKILSYIDAAEYDLVYVNSYGFESPNIPKTPRRFQRQPIKISCPEMFVRRIHIFFTFISGNIVNKDRVLSSRQAPFSDLLGTSLVQLGWIYTALNGYVQGLYISEKLVGMRINNTGGYLLLQAFGPNLKQITEKWLRCRALRRLIINGELQTFWPGALLNSSKMSGRFEKESAPEEVLTPVFKDNWRYWIFVYPVLIAPYVMARCWVFGLGIINRVDKMCGSVIMK